MHTQCTHNTYGRSSVRRDSLVGVRGIMGVVPRIVSRVLEIILQFFDVHGERADIVIELIKLNVHLADRTKVLLPVLVEDDHLVHLGLLGYLVGLPYQHLEPGGHVREFVLGTSERQCQLDVEHAVDTVRKLLVNLVDLVDNVSIQADGNVVGDLGCKSVQLPTRGHETQVCFEAEILLDDVSEDFIWKLHEPATVLRAVLCETTTVHKDGAHVVGTHGWQKVKGGGRTVLGGRSGKCKKCKFIIKRGGGTRTLFFLEREARESAACFSCVSSCVTSSSPRATAPWLYERFHG